MTELNGAIIAFGEPTHWYVNFIAPENTRESAESLKKELEQMENMLNLFDKSKYDDLIKNQRTQEDIQNAELRKEIVDLAYFWDGKESMKYGNSLLKLLGSEK